MTDRVPMTDREAIRRLATIVSELAYATGHQNFTDQALTVIEHFARSEPSAPAVTGAPFRPDDPPICSCREFYPSHPPDCPTQPNANYHDAILAELVKDEEAEEIAEQAARRVKK